MDILALAVGLLIGSVTAVSIYKWVDIGREAENQQKIEAFRKEMELSLRALAGDALSKNTEDFLRLAKDNLGHQLQSGEKSLEHKRELVDKSVHRLTEELTKVQTLVKEFENDRNVKFGKLSSEITATSTAAAQLRETTGRLAEALASSKTRGQWGERMAEDVLRLVGFSEGVNYRKQKQLDNNRRPDFTFLLPQDRILNMDVKFPLENYLRYLEAEGGGNGAPHRDQFLKDVRGMLKAVNGRDYINPEDNTLDCALVFIPNEHIYAFIHQHDPALLDDALKMRLVLCSPITLYAVLAVIRQASDLFQLEKTASGMLAHFGAFNKQWNEFTKSFDEVGKRMDKAREAFDAMTTTRKNKLEVPLRKIEDLRRQKNIMLADSSAEDGVSDAENV
jgi:DNA recombination protein RmuC